MYSLFTEAGLMPGVACGRSRTRRGDEVAAGCFRLHGPTTRGEKAGGATSTESLASISSQYESPDNGSESGPR
ncbi:hypothetical protein EYF80_056584 [Liparis tanakae]|uniref:Uncharacterized protein n=1 Tax=Liparis tanakae TaxID=230148 RepID=A0A4Z2EXF5_9TELE|nr:hypothetical protein EYF80_056584 [Liparis tanakae]